MKRKAIVLDNDDSICSIKLESLLESNNVCEENALGGVMAKMFLEGVALPLRYITERCENEIDKLSLRVARSCFPSYGLVEKKKIVVTESMLDTLHTSQLGYPQMVYKRSDKGEPRYHWAMTDKHKVRFLASMGYSESLTTWLVNNGIAFFCRRMFDYEMSIYQEQEEYFVLSLIDDEFFHGPVYARPNPLDCIFRQMRKAEKELGRNMAVEISVSKKLPSNVVSRIIAGFL